MENLGVYRLGWWTASVRVVILVFEKGMRGRW
jgi:hypothetical protein